MYKNILKTTSDYKTLKMFVKVRAGILCCTNRSNFSIANRSLFSSSSFVGYNVCGGVFDKDNKTRYTCVANVNENKCNLFRTRCRSFSVQPSIDSAAQSYAKIFKCLSESTVVEYAQNMIIVIHDQSGLPWWASIMLTTVLLRSLVTLPLSLHQNYVTAKLNNVSTELKEIAKELGKETTIAARQFYWTETQAKIMFRLSMKKQWKKLIERDNCHPAKTSLLVLFQIPMWIVFSVALRNIVYMTPHADAAAFLRYLELCTEGFLWIPNLTIADTFVLPITLGLTNLAIIEIQAMMRTHENRSRLQVYATNFFRCFCLLMVPFAAVVPSCLSLYWTTSSVYGLVQNLILLSPKLKKLAGIPRTPDTLDHPYKHLADKIKKHFV